MRKLSEMLYFFRQLQVVNLTLTNKRIDKRENETIVDEFNKILEKYTKYHTKQKQTRVHRVNNGSNYKIHFK